jgi:hypothetical protein
MPAQGAEEKRDSRHEGFKAHDGIGTVRRREAGSMRKEFHMKGWKRGMLPSELALLGGRLGGLFITLRASLTCQAFVLTSNLSVSEE